MMNAKLRLVFHTITSAHHLFIGMNTFFFDFSKTSDPEVTKLDKYRCRFLTGWTFTLQMIYFLLALTQDVLQKRQSHKNILRKLEIVKGYLFTTLIFPTTLYVTVMFWFFFNVNREWVFPAAVDSIIPNWFNHSVHTNTLIALIMEMLLVKNQFVPKFNSALIGLTVYTAIYYSIYVVTYLQTGLWLYSLFYIISWTERILFFVVTYLTNVLLIKMGIHLQNVKYNTAKMLKLRVK